MKAKLIKDRLFLKKIADNYTLHRIKDGILTIEGDSHYTIKGIHPFYKLSLKNCQAIERGYDLDELAREFCHPGNGVRDNFQPVFKGIFIQGFQKCLELMGDKKFSAGQLLNAMDLVWQWIHGEDYGCKTLTEVQDKHIQSLQQTEWDCIIEMEEIQEIYRDGTTKYERVAKLDADGCLILKRI